MPTKPSDTKKAAGKTAAGKDAAGKTTGGKTNALQQPLKPSEELAAVVGQGPLPRAEVVSKVWDYIKSNNLQNPQDKREILADDKLKKVFGTSQVHMMKMSGLISKHLS